MTRHSMSNAIYGPIPNPYPPIQNKYYKLYMNICRSRQQLNRVDNGIYAEHHIIPKSFYKKYSDTGWFNLNPDIDPNLVLLTDREHFIVHWLLTKAYRNLPQLKMVRAFQLMSEKDKTSKYYEISKKIYRKTFNNRQPVTCIECGIIFYVVASKNSKYCSTECYNKNRYGNNNSNWKGGSFIETCKICGKSFETQNRGKRYKRFCSRKCGAKNRMNQSGGPTAKKIHTPMGDFKTLTDASTTLNIEIRKLKKLIETNPLEYYIILPIH